MSYEHQLHECIKNALTAQDIVHTCFTYLFTFKSKFYE